MTLGTFSYLITTLIFAGTAILIEWLLSFKRLKKYAKVIAIITGLGIAFALITEPVALKWRIWFYSQNKVLGIYVLGMPLESLAYVALVAVAIASATLVWSDFEENKKPLIKTTIRKIKSKV